jgi:hypothetical protein
MLQMKVRKRVTKSTVKAALIESINKATGLNRAKRGPEPERLKIEGDWKAAVTTAMRKPKPPKGWPKR